MLDSNLLGRRLVWLEMMRVTRHWLVARAHHEDMTSETGHHLERAATRVDRLVHAFSALRTIAFISLIVLDVIPICSSIRLRLVGWSVARTRAGRWPGQIGIHHWAIS